MAGSDKSQCFGEGLVSPLDFVNIIRESARACGNMGIGMTRELMASLQQFYQIFSTELWAELVLRIDQSRRSVVGAANSSILQYGSAHA